MSAYSQLDPEKVKQFEADLLTVYQGAGLDAASIKIIELNRHFICRVKLTGRTDLQFLLPTETVEHLHADPGDQDGETCS